MDKNGRRREWIGTLVEWTPRKQITTYHQPTQCTAQDKESQARLAIDRTALAIDLHKYFLLPKILVILGFKICPKKNHPTLFRKCICMQESISAKYR